MRAKKKRQSRETKKSQLRSRVITGLILALFFGAALFIRVYFPYDRVFSGEWIKFTGIDAYYHMRLVDNLVHNFPNYMSVDPYFIYPGATGVISIGFLGWLLASITWVIGLGSPTQHTVDVVAVYFPAVLGALTVIPVYFIGKELFGRWAGMLSAGLLVLLGGEFLGRSILGFMDHDVANTLFTTVAILFLILAIKTASQRGLTFSHLKRQYWAVSARPVIYSLLAGLFLGLYLLTWAGALIFVLLFAVYFVIQFLIDHLRYRPTSYLGVIGTIFFLVSIVVSIPILSSVIYLASLIIALFIPLVLGGLSWLMARKEKIRSFYYPLAVVGLGLAGIAIFWGFNPPVFNSMIGAFSIFIPTATSVTTIEMQPLLFPNGLPPVGEFTTVLAWGNFNTNFFLVPPSVGWPIPGFSLISLGLLVYLVIRRGDADKTLLVVWSLIILLATLGQRRFAAYLAVNVALLTGYLSWRFLTLAGLREPGSGVAETAKEVVGKKARPKKGGYQITVSQITIALVLLIILLFVFLPNVLQIEPGMATTIDTARLAPFAPSDAWYSSLSWLKENTPDPFDNPDAYYALHQPPPAGESYSYSDSAYGVLAWWDYGYWITRIGRRLPVANPSQASGAVTSVASFFTAQDEGVANEIVKEMGASYIIIDDKTAGGKLWAIARWAGREATEYLDSYLRLQDNYVVQETYLRPEYYQTLSTRLYNFDGQAVTPEEVMVIAYEEITVPDVGPFKLITSYETFDSYQEAESFIESQEAGNYRIVGTDPFTSPVPLAALEHYQLIYSSDDTVGSVPEVKIFKYLD